MVSTDPLPLIVFAGAATYDAITVVDHFPGPNERQTAHAVRYAGGGPAATAAVAAARLGAPSAFVGTVGDDEEGERIAAGLRAEGVDISGLRVVAGQPSQASVVVIDRARATRAICTRAVAPLDPADHPRLLDRMAEGAWLHVDHRGWPAARALLDRLPPGRRPGVSVDGGNPIERLRLRDVDLYVPTVESLAGRYGIQPVTDLLNAALADGATTVVATRGADGSVAARAGTPLVTAPGLSVEVVSTLGAGDVFHGALLAAWVRDLPLTECLRYANVAAALSCQGIDGRSAIPNDAEVRATLLADRTDRPEEHA
ncbi:carbohydrate kinase family protein [Micromonospora sp. MS34]|uniref:carbohydrate kinase family protein n=1 Tax=Micromonospora sp. MS34 TaxID=3385971 RepID=UPI00399F41CC